MEGSLAREKIGADTLGCISTEGLLRACGKCGLGLCDGSFTGRYATEVGEHSKTLMEKK